MCKHKSGGSRRQQTTASTSSNEAKVEPSMGTSQEYQVDGGKPLDKRNIRIAVVPVHHGFSPSTSITKEDQVSKESDSLSLSQLEDENADECNETSPMLFDDQSISSVTCALPDSNKPNYLESSEEDVLLHESPASIITLPNGLGECDKSKKNHNRWRSGVVVCPSVGSLNGEWRDVFQVNSLSNLSYGQMPRNFDYSTESVPSSHSWFLRDNKFCNFDIRPRSTSLTHVGCPKEIPTCSHTEEEEGAAPSMPLGISPSPFLQHTLMQSLQCSSSIASNLTESGTMPICKICHMPSTNGDPLISPCRCSGTMQYIHYNCLMKWLLYSNRRSRRPPTCELCQYQYHWHKKFKVGGWQFPRCSQRDKMYHFTFILAVMIMVASATVTILCFSEDKGIRASHDGSELTNSEIITLASGVLFFVAFFLALYVEVKARINVYRLFLKFVYLNQQWYFDEYKDKNNAVVSV